MEAKNVEKTECDGILASEKMNQEGEKQDGSCNAVERGEFGTGDFTGMSGGAGNDVAVVGAGKNRGMEADSVPGTNEIIGAAESGGCESTPFLRLIRNWREIISEFDSLKAILDLRTVRRYPELLNKSEIERLHQKTLNMAAALERIQMEKNRMKTEYEKELKEHHEKHNAL